MEQSTGGREGAAADDMAAGSKPRLVRQGTVRGVPYPFPNISGRKRAGADYTPAGVCGADEENEVYDNMLMDQFLACGEETGESRASDSLLYERMYEDGGTLGHWETKETGPEKRPRIGAASANTGQTRGGFIRLGGDVCHWSEISQGIDSCERAFRKITEPGVPKCEGVCLGGRTRHRQVAARFVQLGLDITACIYAEQGPGPGVVRRLHGRDGDTD